MRRIPSSLPGGTEHLWLRRSQWRMVTALVLLLGVVVGSLALVAGFWWAARPRVIVAERPRAAAPALPVATEVVPSRPPSVVEVYPASWVGLPRPSVVVSSPGGIVTQVAARPGERVTAGQPLLRLKQPLPAPAGRRAAPIATPRPPDPAPAREAALRRRLASVRGEIARTEAAAMAAAPAARVVQGPAWAVREADSRVQQARAAVAAAVERRLATDEQYQRRRASRFQFHLARSGELLAEVELRRAEEEASAARQALGGTPGAAQQAAASQAAAQQAHARRRIAQLKAEAQAIERRLTSVRERVAGTRQQLPAPAPVPAVPRYKSAAVAAPRGGVVSGVWAHAGESVPAGAPLLAIAAPGHARLRAHVPEAALPSFPAGRRVALRQPDGKTVAGRVTRVWKGPEGGTVEVALPPGTPARRGMMLVPPSPHPAAPTLPARAVERINGQAAVWILAHASAAPDQWSVRRQAVHVEPAGRGQVRILGGLRPGDRVVVASGVPLRGGEVVAPVEVGRLRGGE